MIGASVAQGLELAGFTVDWCRDGAVAELTLNQAGYSLLLLDLGLPGQDGLTLLRNIRQAGNAIPVLVMTARDAVSDRVAGLNLGADDYLIKPFDLDELIARVGALIRRQANRTQPEMRLGGLCLNPHSRQASLNGRPLALAVREFALLEALLDQPGRVLSKVELEERIYGWGQEVASNAVEVHLHHLRRKLGAAWVRNVRGVGFKLVEPE